MTRSYRTSANRPANVLFLCAFNATRSIMAEAILNHLGQGRFVAHSAGDQAVGQIHPLTFEVLARHGMPATGLRSKSWGRFFGLGAPQLDYLIIVCDDSYEDLSWPSEGQLIKAYWATPNPAEISEGADAMHSAFESVYASLEKRIQSFIALPLKEMTATEQCRALMQIGEI